MLCSLFIDAQTHSGHADCVLNHRFPLVFLKALHFNAVHLCDALILNFVGSVVPHGALLFCTYQNKTFFVTASSSIFFLSLLFSTHNPNTHNNVIA